MAARPSTRWASRRQVESQVASRISIGKPNCRKQTQRSTSSTPPYFLHKLSQILSGNQGSTTMRSAGWRTAWLARKWRIHRRRIRVNSRQPRSPRCSRVQNHPKVSIRRTYHPYSWSRCWASREWGITKITRPIHFSSHNKHKLGIKMVGWAAC